MQTVTIELNDRKALKLLEDLEALNIIVIRKPVRKAKAIKITQELSQVDRLPKGSKPGKQSKNTSLRKLLLNGPVFTGKQIKTIEDTHKSINEWRTK